MPELPEVETIARSLSPYLVDNTFVSAQLLRPSSLHPLSLPLDALTGARIKNVRRRGKLLILDLASPKSASVAPVEALIAHLRMTGRFLTGSANGEIGKHTRCVFGLVNPEHSHQQLFFDDTRAFGQILLANSKILEAWPFWQKLGPEPLEISPENFIGRLTGRRPIKTALLDQKVIAGIGNIYADESLFRAGIAPERETGSLTTHEGKKLLKAIKQILDKAIRNRGSSIRDYRDADGKSGGFQNLFMVYHRGGQACKKCGHTLQKIKLGGRSTVFCPVCQA